MILKIFILLVTLFFSSLSANIIDIATVNEPTNILKQVNVYIDKENKHDFKYILENSTELFKTNQKEMLHLGYSSSAVWLKFSIKNSTNKTIEKVLEISNQMIDNVFLYTKESAYKYNKQENGILHRKTFDENILHMYFDISLKPKSII